MPQEETEEVFVEDASDCLCLEYYRTYHKKLDKNCRDDCERQSSLHQAYGEPDGTDYSDSETEAEAEVGAFNLRHDNHKVTELALECAAVATDVALWATEYTATSGQVQGGMNTYTSHTSNSDHVTTVYADHAKRDESSEYTDEFYHSVDKLNIRDRHVALTSNYEGHRQRALEYLDLSGCFQVTDLGIR